MVEAGTQPLWKQLEKLLRQQVNPDNLTDALGRVDFIRGVNGHPLHEIALRRNHVVSR